MLRPRRQDLILLLTCIVIAACGRGGSAIPSDASCDGVGAAVGGCAPDRPSFTAASCEEIGQEFGRQVNDRFLSIYAGPESREESKAVRAFHYLTVAASLANARVRELGLVTECDADEFLAAAEAEFSGDFRAHAGELLHDGDPVSYGEWREAALAVLSILDQEEDAPVASPSS